MITPELKLKIIERVKAARDQIGTSARLAQKLGINAAQISRIINGETEGVLSEVNWITLARRVGVALGGQLEIKIAETQTFKYINAQIAACQTNSIALVLCDEAGIGKTFAARHYVAAHKNAVYIDCSQVKSKQRLVRKIATEFGISQQGRYAEVYEDLVFYLRSSATPLVVIDEAGDLDYPAFLELKALWNATEHACGWYMMGADGLRAKINRSLAQNKVGYTEIMRRYGERFQKVTPDGGTEITAFHKKQVAQVALANGIADVQAMYARTGGSLSRLYLELQKLKNAQ